MSGIISWKTTKVVLGAGAVVAIVSLFASPSSTARMTSGAVYGESFGLGVLGGSIKWAAPGYRAGAAAAAQGPAPAASAPPTTAGGKSWSLTGP